MTHDALSTALDDTRKALLSGDISALTDLATRTEQALETFIPADARALDAMRRQAERNLRCLGAALAGLRNARSRLTEIERMNSTIGYDDKGQRRSLASSVALTRRL